MKQKNGSKNKSLLFLTFILYNILLLPFHILLPFVLILLFPFYPRIRKNFLERFGLIKNAASLKGKILIHSSSVGEFNGVRPLVSKLIKENHPVSLSSFTDTGIRNIKMNFSDIFSFILPLDFPLFLLPILRNKPKSILLIEADLWPNLILLAGLLDIDIFLINGRISKKKTLLILLLPFFYKPVFSCFRKVFLQDSLSEENLRRSGITRSAEVPGSTKMDISHLHIPDKNKIELLRKKMSLKGKTVIIGGSLRRKEFKILIRSFVELKQKFSRLSLILAPRHLTDLPKYKDFLESEQISFSKLTDSDKQQALTDIHLVDTMGILMTIYALGDITFIGGTLEPLGGHNPLEPALMGNVVLHGPSIHNNFSAFSLLSKCKISFNVTQENLTRKIAELLNNRSTLKQLGKKASTCVRSQKAVTQTIYDKIF